MSTVETATEIRTFQVDVADEALDDLRRRIAATRWPSKELVEDASQGVQLATLQELARYWATEHDWRKTEAKLNALPQFKTEIDVVEIHFIHVKSPHADALPLIMTHGWPGSVIELLEVVGPLTTSSSSMTEPGQPCVMISGNASACGDFTWMKWISTTSISVLNCGSALSFASVLRQSCSVAQ